MDARLVVLVFGVQMFLGNVLDGATYAPGPAMSCFKVCKGEWKEKLVAKDADYWERFTKGWYSLTYEIFTIEVGMTNGKWEAGSMLQIQQQSEIYCHAIVYSGGRSRYYHGAPKRGAKLIVMKSLLPSLKQERYLVIDLRDCPKKPPVFEVHDELPEGEKEPVVK